MKIFKISLDNDFNALCKNIGVHGMGQKIMSEKAKLNYFYIKGAKYAAINILKQDALSCGAELLSPKNAILGGSELGDALLIANEKQCRILAKKEALQDFSLKELSNFLNLEFQKPAKPLIMGVLNITDDSYNKASCVSADEIAARAQKMIDEGAHIIDIGAASTSPNSEYIGADAEFERVKCAVHALDGILGKAIFSIDTFDENCAKYALEHGFRLLNDISANENLAKIAGANGAKYCFMHGGIKGDSTEIKGEILGILDEFFARKLEVFERFLKKDDLILDIGVGFGKSHEQSLSLIKNLEHFLHFGCDLLVGASRKSIINAYFESSVEERLPGSLFLHLKAHENGAKIIRTHDTSEHAQLFALFEAYKCL